MSISPEKLLFIAVVALLVLGPQRLPALARSVGRMLGELRRLSGGLQEEMRDALAEPRQILHDAMGDTDLGSVSGSVANSVRELLDPPESAPPTPAGTGSVGGRSGDPARQGSMSLPAPPDDPSLN